MSVNLTTPVVVVVVLLVLVKIHCTPGHPAPPSADDLVGGKWPMGSSPGLRIPESNQKKIIEQKIEFDGKDELRR